MNESRLNGLGDTGATLLAAVDRKKGVGLPFATLIFSGILSAAAFGIQMVQHAFEMRQANIENGFKYYSDNRTKLKARADADEEMSLLKIIANAFPNVYCDVRQDVYERASAADIGVTPVVGQPTPFGEADRKNLVSFLIDRDRPTNPQFATGFFGVMSAAFAAKGGGLSAEPCTPLAEATQALAQAQAAEPAADKDEKMKTAAAPPAAPTAGEMEEVVQTARRSTGQQEARVYRVFFHIGANRAVDLADRFRDELAEDQFRVMQGIQRVDPKILPSNAEIRYFGPQDEAAATWLADYLTQKFKSENLVFTIKAIGYSYPYMSPDNIEVWLPEPKASTQKKAPSKAG